MIRDKPSYIQKYNHKFAISFLTERHLFETYSFAFHVDMFFLALKMSTLKYTTVQTTTNTGNAIPDKPLQDLIFSEIVF